MTYNRGEAALWLVMMLLWAIWCLSGCQYTSCTFSTVKLVSGAEMVADVRQVPVDKSTTSASPTTATQTVSPSTTVSGLPGM